MTPLGIALGIVIGLALGLLGGGGSILTVPVFVYVLGFGAKEAIAMSLGVVGAVALVGALTHGREGNVNVRVALLFGSVAMAGTYAGARLAVLVSGELQLALFAGVMLVAAVFMFRAPGPVTAPPRHRRGSRLARAGAYGLLALEALAVGVLTGLVGVGGGFLIVPVLVLLGGVGMKEAIGTSLLVIAMKSASGFYGYLGQVEVAWVVMTAFTAAAVVGIFAGTRLTRHLPARALRRGFALFLVAMGSIILYQNRGVFLASADDASPPAERQADSSLEPSASRQP